MKHKTMLSLATVHQQCIANNKSEVDTLQLMQDATGQSLDTCIKYYNFESYFHRQLFEEIDTVLSIIDRLNPITTETEEVYKIITSEEDKLYIKSNLLISQIIAIIESILQTEVKDYDLLEEYDGDLDYIIIKQIN